MLRNLTHFGFKRAIIGQMERAAGLAHDDKPQAKLDKLDAVLAQTSTSIQDAALFAEMLSLPNDGRYPALELTPQQRRQKTLVALNSQLETLARQTAVLMIFEDAHWTDPTSLEVLGRTADRIKALPVLLIVTFRPEFNAPWVGQPHVTSLTLNRLGKREAAAIIAGLVGNKELPADVMAEIVERTDGIPLFVEEMTKAVLETESEGAARRTVAAIPSPALAVPASLNVSLMARLDRARVLPRAAGFGGAQARGGPGIGAKSPGRGGLAVQARRATTRDLSIQTCPGAGRGLWDAAARAKTRAARPNCRNP
jgi:predicted ATPase